MAIDNINVVDAIGIDKKDSTKVNLFIFDHLDWEEELDHIKLLQDKINRYIDFIESGDIYEEYSSCKDINNIRFDICAILKYEPAEVAINFFEAANKQIEDTNISISYEVGK